MNHQAVEGSMLAALLATARETALNAYAPYSKFRVGAALLLSNGKAVAGANVENSSFGLTICAERAALVAAVTQYGPSIRIEAVALANLNAKPGPPCGACRQMLSEFIEQDAPVVFPIAFGDQTMTFRELFPASFVLKEK